MSGLLYEIVIRGVIGRTVAAAFDRLEVISTADGHTTLRGWIPDQSALQGILEQISDFGLELTSVAKVGGERR